MTASANKIKYVLVWFITLPIFCNASVALAQSEPSLTSRDYEFIIIMLAVAVIYPLPAIIAFIRKHPNKWPILVVNILFGGTGIGWLGTLVWAMSAVHLSPTGSNGGESGLNLFVNDPQPIKIIDQPPQNQEDIASQLQKLKALLDQDAISKKEYELLKKSMLDKLSD